MAYEQYAALVQWHADGTATLTDATHLIDLTRSQFGGDARAETDIRELYFALYEGQSVAIDTFMHVWAGWRDPATGAWDPDRRPYAGIIIDHEGYMEAGEHVLHATCTGYGDYGATTRILSWPVNDPDSTQTGAAIDLPVHEWITGSSIPGVMTNSFNDLVQIVIVPSVGDIILDAGHLPGILIADYETDSPAATFGFCYVQDAIEEVLKAAHAVDNGVRPLAFWRPAICQSDTTLVVPELVIIDLNNTSGDVVATVHATNTPDTGEVVPEDTHHQRVGRKAYQRIVTKGTGGDPTLGTIGRHVVYYDYADTDHIAAYPDPFRLFPGRALILHERTLATVEEAHDYAQRVETQVWAPRGTLTCTLYDKDMIAAGIANGIDVLEVGALLRYIDAKETLDLIYPIVSVQRIEEKGLRHATVQFGFTPLDVQDVDVGGTGDMPWLYDGTNPFVGPNAGGGGTSSLSPNGGAIGMPAPFPLVTQPDSSNRNVIRQNHQGALPLTLAGSDRQRHAPAPGAPELAPARDLTPDLPDPLADPTPMLKIVPRKSLRDNGVPGGYYDKFGFWQPNCWMFEFVPPLTGTTPDPIRLMLPRWLRLRITDWDKSDSGASVVFTVISGGVSGTRTTPFDMGPSDILIIQPASVPGAGYLLITLPTGEYGGVNT
jgi:hypothetical protein